MENGKDRPSLLFTRGFILDEKTGLESESYFCLWPVKSDPCGFITTDFSKLIDHFKQHSLDLKKGTDFCTMCEKIFSNRIQATEHYIRHSLDIKALYREGIQTEQLDGIFEKLSDIRKEILDYLFCNEEDYDDEPVL